MAKSPFRIISVFAYILQVSISFGLHHSANEDEWSFIVLADWHNAEYFAIDPSEDSKIWRQKYDQIQSKRDIWRRVGGPAWR